jgi:hypothetical protein
MCSAQTDEMCAVFADDLRAPSRAGSQGVSSLLRWQYGFQMRIPLTLQIKADKIFGQKQDNYRN